MLMSLPMQLLQVFAIVLLTRYFCVCLRAEAPRNRDLPIPLKDEDMFCETCYATVSEMHRIIKSSDPDGGLESRIDSALADVCTAEKMALYALPAKELTNACRYLKVEFENELGLGLMAAFQPGREQRLAATVSDICVSRIRACTHRRAIPSVRQRLEKKKSPTPAISDRPASTEQAHASADDQLQKHMSQHSQLNSATGEDAGRKDEL